MDSWVLTQVPAEWRLSPGLGAGRSRGGWCMGAEGSCEPRAPGLGRGAEFHFSAFYTSAWWGWEGFFAPLPQSRILAPSSPVALRF